MLIIHPQSVKFGQAIWEDVAAIAIERAPERTALEWTDFGPHPALADVPEQRTTIRLTRRLLRDDLGAPRPGDTAELTFHTSPTSSHAARTRLRATVVITTVAYQLAGPKPREQPAALQSITMLAISPDGATDPITLEDTSDGSS